ncbi:inorganic phosphate transporter, PiT family [Singulisphaera sp. GP187]|uniref:inorganic phosphate transporter n=1 Tax=Singulisphaera sp. GP187 TaxID=1882752 RepID=UPI00092AD97D|nr:inorganic phosphate transporter [Singulisphaera sp. GP187]SIO32424.1 inorganic phosphate transporter, PiT family [Singulisphaera sp. GP187]
MIFALFNGSGSLSGGSLALLIVALAIALGFEFVNGFHDTANAVATVIYTKSLRPWPAVLWSGFCNFCGVYLGGTAVAFSIVNLLPVDLLIRAGSGAGLAMVLALLIAAILWNLGTWFLGLPTSSSHTLIGAIVGVGLANSLLPGHVFGEGVNWDKAGEVGLSLLLSPLIGFSLSAGLYLLLKATIRSPELYAAPPEDRPPPFWIRAVLVSTCTGVSFAHGSNDGQKGIGLIMLILIGVVPAHYALNPETSASQVQQTVAAAAQLESLLRQRESIPGVSALLDRLTDLRATLERYPTLRSIPEGDRWRVRADLLKLSKGLATLKRAKHSGISTQEWKAVEQCRAEMKLLIEYSPTWVLMAVATALGVGTTVGWKRIVLTVGEKIGKSHLTYAQGASAELVAMSTIGLADLGGLPVSTTHVLSSGVAGTMAASGSGLQGRTVRNIALAWLLTLPVSMLLAGGLYLVFRLAVV